MRTPLKAVLVAFVAFICIVNAQDDPNFTTPELLKDNVQFWKKIYTEVALNEGFLHDRLYPMVIYAKLNPRDAKKTKEHVLAMLTNINTQPETTWSEEERGIVNLFKEKADSSALIDAAERVRFQLGQADRFKEGIIRSGFYLDTIKAIFREYNIPERLCYLPHVESSFNTNAYSKVGAAGLWQFMRGTGKLFGMRIDYTIDERKDPVAATRAAAKYLSSSYKELKSWPCAITSYNYGFYGMKRAVAATGSNDLEVIIKNYSSPSFKFASTNFYSCFLAASEVAQNHVAYFPSVKLAPRIHFSDLTLDHYISPDVLSNYLGLTKQQLMILNPAIRSTVFDQRKQLPRGFTIHIPSSNADKIKLAVASIPDSLKSTIPDRPKYYRVNKGDNLYEIATNLGVSVKELADENNISRKSRLRAGQVLRVPEKIIKTVVTAMAKPPKQQSQPTMQQETIPAAPVAYLAKAAANESTSAVAEIAQAETPFTSAITEEGVDDPNNDEVSGTTAQSTSTTPIVNSTVVSETDTQKVSKQTVTPKEIKKQPTPSNTQGIADSLKEAAFTPATVPEQTQGSSQKPAIPVGFDVTVYALDVEMSSVGTAATLLVSVDETVGHYADWLDIPTYRIRQLNKINRQGGIRISQKLIIPVEKENSLEKFVNARLEYHMALEEDFYGQYKVSDTKQMTITKGQTLWDICHQGDNEIPLWLFKKYNKQLDLGKLMPGMTVWLPLIEEKSEKEMGVPSDSKKVLAPLVKPAVSTPQNKK